MTLFDMSGIEKRETKENSHGLEALLNAGDAFFNEFGRLSWKEMIDLMKKNRNYAKEFIKEKLNGTEYSTEDIEDYVIIKSAEGTRNSSSLNSNVLGEYSGKILSLLTEENSSKGKKTVIKIDGKGGTFDRLFYGAEFFDEVYISNMNGEGICSSMANGNILALNNCNGGNTATFIGAGSNGGVKAAILNNANSTHNLFYDAAFINGHIGLAMLNNSTDSYHIEMALSLIYPGIERLVIRNKFNPEKFQFEDLPVEDGNENKDFKFYADEYAFGIENDSEIMVANNVRNKREYGGHLFGRMIEPNTELQEFLKKNGIDRMAELSDKMVDADLDTIQENARMIYHIHNETATKEMLEGRDRYYHTIRLFEEIVPDVLEEIPRKPKDDSNNYPNQEKIYENAGEKIQKKASRWIKNTWYDIREIFFINQIMDKIRGR
ncbi:MAG: hypothetical protein NTV63_04790 [Candidatus Woesearchaeota archaeon]|nr:hypothetical protein [Candidatus Woesearchaeota archaeon]